MELYMLGDVEDKKALLEGIGVHDMGVDIIEKKMKLFSFYIVDLKTPAVHILKQDALSIGAELAVPSSVILSTQDSYDCILIGNKKQIEILSKKELIQPFGLKVLAKKLSSFLEIKKFSTKIMGVINANDDSFFEGSRFVKDDAVKQIKSMIKDGADIIDIGAVSSRPNAEVVEAGVELERIRYICDVIKSQKLYELATFSIDSCTLSVVEYALKSGFSFINDITGAKDVNIIKLAVEFDAKLSIMHMKGTPQTMQSCPEYDNVMVEIDTFFRDQILKCESLGLKRDNIILDVGIGFGKSLEHNLTLIKNLAHFKHHKCEILIGASRKSLIDNITLSSPEDRLAGTLAIHLKALNNGAGIIRCHDVYEHDQAFMVNALL